MSKHALSCGFSFVAIYGIVLMVVSLIAVTQPVAASGTLNVKTFGAIGNGQTDDSAAINSALVQAKAQQAALFFPHGDYLFAADLIDDSVVMFGDNNTGLHATNGSKIVLTGNKAALTNFRITSSGSLPASLVYVTNATNFSVCHNRIEGPANVDLQVRYSTNGNVLNNDLDKADNTNLYAIGSSNVCYDRNQIDGKAVIGLEFDLGGNQANNTVIRNVFAGDNTQTILVLGLQNSSINHNILKDSDGFGIGLFGTGFSVNNIVIDSNDIKGASEGIVFNGVENLTISNNIIKHSNLDAIQDTGGGSGTLAITNNTIINAGFAKAVPPPPVLAVILVSNSAYSSVTITNNRYLGGAHDLTYFIDSQFHTATITGNTTTAMLPNLV
ncbi:MAG: hypothetical protein C5B53_08965 [Candidatus Melainabacteria bacterium]|nr:MAG: hypothetical protein C5B53_08965 [Candidatus Melainabacteria bacterium]